MAIEAVEGFVMATANMLTFSATEPPVRDGVYRRAIRPDLVGFDRWKDGQWSCIYRGKLAKLTDDWFDKWDASCYQTEGTWSGRTKP